MKKIIPRDKFEASVCKSRKLSWKEKRDIILEHREQQKAEALEKVFKQVAMIFYEVEQLTPVEMSKLNQQIDGIMKPGRW